jgi:hypothetical protein
MAFAKWRSKRQLSGLRLKHAELINFQGGNMSLRKVLMQFYLNATGQFKRMAMIHETKEFRYLRHINRFRKEGRNTLETLSTGRGVMPAMRAH